MVDCSQVSVIITTPQFQRELFSANCSLSSSILFTMDLAFERKMLRSASLNGSLFSRASSPALQPRFCFLCIRFLAGYNYPRRPGSPDYVSRYIVEAMIVWWNSPSVAESQVLEILTTVSPTNCTIYNKKNRINTLKKAPRVESCERLCTPPSCISQGWSFFDQDVHLSRVSCFLFGHMWVYIRGCGCFIPT